MSNKKKLVNKEGSAMVIVIIAMSLFLIVSAIIIGQINNQIKSNSKLYKETQSKYLAEAHIEKDISNIYKNTSVFIDRIKNISADECNNEDSHKHPYTNTYNGKTITATIDVIVTGNGKSKSKEIKKTIDINELKNLKIESIVDKYKVTTIVDFNIDDKFNLSYEVKRYTREVLQ